MLTPLSTGCIQTLMSGEDVNQPILQVLGIKKIQTSGDERFRLLVSDGKYLNSYTMLATQINDLVKKGDLSENAIIKVDKYVTSMVNRSSDQSKNEKRVLIILGLSVLHRGEEVKEKIGDPVSYESAAPAAVTTVSSNMFSAKNQSDTVSNTNKTTSNNTGNYMMNINPMLNISTTHPITSLSPYHSKWVIKVRVTSKSSIRKWNNDRGEGKLFSMDLMDESGEIRATAFKDECDRFYDIIEPDKVYFISKCQLKPANKQFTNIKNDYEMTFTRDTIVQPCEEFDNSIPNIQYDFVPISHVANIEPNSTIDVIGICKETGEVSIFQSKQKNREFTKREITLVDSSNTSINLTLWGDDALNFNGMGQPVVLVKNCRVSEFGGGKTINLAAGSTLKLNPDIPEGHKLRGWFDNGGSENVMQSISTRTNMPTMKTDWLTFYEARTQKLGATDKPGFFQTKAVIHMVSTNNAFYKACPKPDCNKKVIDEDNGQYRCEKCSSVNPDFKYRLLMNMSIGDWTGMQWATCFNELSEQLLHKTAQEVGDISHDTEKFSELLSKIYFTEFVFKFRVKIDTFGDVPRNRYTVMAATPVNHKEYNAYLIKNLQDATGIGKH